MSIQLRLPHSLSAADMQHCPVASVPFRAEMQQVQSPTGQTVRLLQQYQADHYHVWASCVLRVAGKGGSSDNQSLSAHDACLGLVGIAGGCEGWQLNSYELSLCCLVQDQGHDPAGLDASIITTFSLVRYRTLVAALACAHM